MSSLKGGAKLQHGSPFSVIVGVNLSRHVWIQELSYALQFNASSEHSSHDQGQCDENRATGLQGGVEEGCSHVSSNFSAGTPWREKKHLEAGNEKEEACSPLPHRVSAEPWSGTKRIPTG